jgi:hypothetical protein
MLTVTESIDAIRWLLNQFGDRGASKLLEETVRSYAGNFTNVSDNLVEAEKQLTNKKHDHYFDLPYPSHNLVPCIKKLLSAHNPPLTLGKERTKGLRFIANMPQAPVRRDETTEHLAASTLHHPPDLGSSNEDIELLACDALQWFAKNTHPRTGLVLDRGPNFGGHEKRATMSSIAATGFSLTLLPAAVDKKVLTSDEARERALTALRFSLASVPHVRGILLHFVDWKSGQRFGRSEYSILDTAIFLHGAIVAAQAFGQAVPEITEITSTLLDRVEWDQLVLHRDGRPVLSHGYDGDSGQLLRTAADMRSGENLMPCVLAAGSRTHPTDSWCWYNTRAPSGPASYPIDSWMPSQRYSRVMNSPFPLFTGYVGLVWMKLEGMNDHDQVDLWGNARLAAQFNRDYCRSVSAPRFATYRVENGGWWGLSAGDSPQGYVARGPRDGDEDGTVWPTAALASVAWIPSEIASDLQAWRTSPWWPKVRGPYGLAPFSIDRNWVGPDIIGIDIGSFAANWINFQSQGIHNLWHSHPAAKAGLKNLDFHMSRDD